MFFLAGLFLKVVLNESRTCFGDTKSARYHQLCTIPEQISQSYPRTLLQRFSYSPWRSRVWGAREGKQWRKGGELIPWHRRSPRCCRARHWEEGLREWRDPTWSPSRPVGSFSSAGWSCQQWSCRSSSRRSAFLPRCSGPASRWPATPTCSTPPGKWRSGDWLRLQGSSQSCTGRGMAGREGQPMCSVKMVISKVKL